MSKRPFFNYSEEDMLSAVADVKSRGIKVATAAKTWHVPRITLRRKVLGNAPLGRKMGRSTVLTAVEEETLLKWALSVNKAGFPVSKEQFLVSVKQIVKKLGRPNPFKEDKPGRYWYEGFLKRHPQLSERTPQNLTSSRANVSESQIKNWFCEVYSYLESKGLESVLRDPTRIFNADEAAFFLNPKGHKVLAAKGEKSVYSIVNTDEKECLTVLLNASASGAVAPPLVVFKYSRLPDQLLASVPKEWALGRSPESGWMTQSLFFEYVTNEFDKWLTEQRIERPILFFVDGHTSHLTFELSQFCDEKKIILVALYPNATHLIQPMDVAVFRTIKAGWKEAIAAWRLQRGGEPFKKTDFCGVLSNVLESRLTPGVLQGGFRKSGLYPWNANAVDYSKTKSREDDTRTQSEPRPTSEEASKIAWLENAIEPRVIDSFKNLGGGPWNGEPELAALYKVWLKLCHLPSESRSESPAAEHGPCENVNNTGAVLELTLPPGEDPAQLLDALEPRQTNPRAAAPIGVPSPFKSTLFWPNSLKDDGKKRKKEKIPTVASSDQWRLYYKKKEEEKQKKLLEKEERKRKREENKQKKEMEQREKRTKNEKKKKRVPVDSDSSESSVDVPELSEEEVDFDDVEIGDWVIVVYENEHYPGLVQDVEEGRYLIAAMERSGQNWKWEKGDSIFYDKEQIVQIISKPEVSNSRGAYSVPEMAKYSSFLM